MRPLNGTTEQLLENEKAGAKTAEFPSDGLKAGQEWLERFRRLKGRAPRILHIGNIDNNAYVNAKLLNRAGLDCDVICYDYYHVMGCPEWEDADFEGKIENDFYPDWRSVDLKGFERPDWFVQGPVTECLFYLDAKRRGFKVLQNYYKKKLKSIRHGKDAAIRFEILDPNKNLVARTWNLQRDKFAVSFSTKLLEKSKGDLDFDARTKSLIALFRELFPGRKDLLKPEDFTGYGAIIKIWKKIFKHYDLIQGYSTDPFLPLLAGETPYVAYEHGTIRDIPFEDSVRGRSCALSYREANAVLVTNADCLPKTKFLGISREKVFPIPHGFNEDRIRRHIQYLRQEKAAPYRFGAAEDKKVFFAPARHHWKNGFDSWLKGNDRIMRAVSVLLKKRHKNFQVVFVEWGKEVDLSKQLIAELGIEDFVRWVKPLPKKDLWHAYASVDGVIDQFVLPCIGGVTYECLAVAHAPVITYLDKQIMEDFFGANIPLPDAKTANQIAERMEWIMTEAPEKIKTTIEKCREWMKVHHSPETILSRHLQVYETVLGGGADGAI